MNQAQQLRDGIQALGLDIDEAKQAKLLNYAALLQKWNKPTQPDRPARPRPNQSATTCSTA